MDYNNKLKELRSEKRVIINSITNLEKSRLEELVEVKRLVEEKYSGLRQGAYSKLGSKSSEVGDYCKLVEKNSTMFSEIFHVIIGLISIFEGECYVLRRVTYHKDKSSPSSVCGAFMIMPKKVFDTISDPFYMRERYINHLVKNKIAMKIVDDWDDFYLPNEFSFYKHDDMGRIIPQISFRGFPYVKEFIDYIINYRIENNIDELSDEDMYRLKDEFVLLNVDNICNNYKLTEEQEVKESTENINFEYRHKQKILSRIVKKIEENK